MFHHKKKNFLSLRARAAPNLSDFSDFSDFSDLAAFLHSVGWGDPDPSRLTEAHTANISQFNHIYKKNIWILGLTVVFF